MPRSASLWIAAVSFVAGVGLAACLGDGALETGAVEQELGDDREPADAGVDASCENPDQDGDGYPSIECGGCDLNDNYASFDGPGCEVGCTSNQCQIPVPRR